MLLLHKNYVDPILYYREEPTTLTQLKKTLNILKLTSVFEIVTSRDTVILKYHVEKKNIATIYLAFSAVLPSIPNL